VSQGINETDAEGDGVDAADELIDAVVDGDGDGLIQATRPTPST
jgi:hypothetical protein